MLSHVMSYHSALGTREASIEAFRFHSRSRKLVGKIYSESGGVGDAKMAGLVLFVETAVETVEGCPRAKEKKRKRQKKFLGSLHIKSS